MLPVNRKLSNFVRFLFIGQGSSNHLQSCRWFDSRLADSWLQLAFGAVISQGVHILFPTYTECLNAVFNIDNQNTIICVLIVQAHCVCLLLWLRWRSYPILWPICAEIQVFPKGSHTFSCMYDMNPWHDSLMYMTEECVVFHNISYSFLNVLHAAPQRTQASVAVVYLGCEH